MQGYCWFWKFIEKLFIALIVLGIFFISLAVIFAPLAHSADIAFSIPKPITNVIGGAVWVATIGLLAFIIAMLLVILVKNILRPLYQIKQPVTSQSIEPVYNPFAFEEEEI